MSNKIFDLLSMEKIEEKQLPQTIDILIMAASVDNRGFAVLEKLMEHKIDIKNIAILDYKKFRPDKVDKEQFYAYYRLEKQENTCYIPCEDEGDDCKYLYDLALGTCDSVLVDITSISVPDIFRLFFVFKECKGVSNINVVYAEPKYYDYLNGIYFEYEQHIGEREYRTLNEYFSSAVSRDVILICFLGFDRLVSQYIHDRKEHSDVVAINGFPSYHPKIKDISLEHNYDLVSTIGYDRVRYAQANNPFSSYNALVSIKEKYQQQMLDICVLGSKPMALGACMFALKNPDCVKVSYPFPAVYKTHTTIEVSDIWWYTIPL